MVIDIHTHTFPEKIAAKALQTLQSQCHTDLFADGTEAGLQAAETKAGVDLAVVQPVATRPDQVSSINRHILQTFAENPPRGLLSFAAMHPACESWEEELEQIARAGLPGIKLHPPYEEVNADDPRTLRILKKCRDLSLAVLMHCGWDVGLPGRAHALPQRLRNALDATGPMKLIAAHMAGWKCWEEAARLLADTGVFPDTSFSLGRLTPAGAHPWQEEDLRLLSDSDFCDLVRAFGADHILFGTDSPWADPAEALDHIRRLPLTAQEKAAICGENARRLLGL